MRAPARIETARLVLRPPTSSDAAAVFERYASDPEVTRFLGWPRHRSVADTEAFLQFSRQEWERWPAGPYLILSRANDQLLGSTGLAFQSPHEAVTGYVLARDAWGQGYATEALLAVLDVARVCSVSRVRALCHLEHRPSQRVLERCGFLLDDPPTRREEFPNLVPSVKQVALCFVFTPEVPKGLTG